MTQALFPDINMGRLSIVTHNSERGSAQEASISSFPGGAASSTSSTAQPSTSLAASRAAAARAAAQAACQAAPRRGGQQKVNRGSARPDLVPISADAQASTSRVDRPTSSGIAPASRAADNASQEGGSISGLHPGASTSNAMAETRSSVGQQGGSSKQTRPSGFTADAAQSRTRQQHRSTPSASVQQQSQGPLHAQGARRQAYATRGPHQFDKAGGHFQTAPEGQSQIAPSGHPQAAPTSLAASSPAAQAHGQSDAAAQLCQPDQQAWHRASSSIDLSSDDLTEEVRALLQSPNYQKPLVGPVIQVDDRSDDDTHAVLCSIANKQMWPYYLDVRGECPEVTLP